MNERRSERVKKRETDIDGDEMDFCVTMLAGFRGGHVYDLARTTLDDDVAAEEGELVGGKGIVGMMMRTPS